MLPTQMALAALLLVTLPFTGDSNHAVNAGVEPLASEPRQAQVPDDAARLVPADAQVLVRLESMQAALDLVNSLAAIPSEDAPSLDASALLGQWDVAGDLAKIAADKPLFLSFSIGPAGAMTTLVLPVVDGAGYAASLPGADPASGEPGWFTASSGGYVGVSRRSGYAVAAQPSAMAKQLRAGTASAHVDVKTLITTFRPIIESGLDMLEGQLDQAVGAQAGPFDMTPMLESYIDGIWAFIDSADGLDLALERRGRSLELSGSFTTLEGSQLAGLGGETAIDLSAYPGVIQPDAAIAVVMGCDWKRLLAQLGPFLDAVVGMYPEPMAAALDTYMQAFSGIYGLMGPVVSASGDLGPNGMRFAYFARSEEPAEMLATLERAIGILGGQGTGMRATGPERIEIGGVPVAQYRVEFDYQQLLALGAGNEELDQDAVEQMRGMMSAIWGKDGLRLALAAKGDLLAMVLGSDDAFLKSTLAQLGGPKKQLPADLQRAVAVASGGSPALVYRLDYGRLFSQMRSLGDLFGEMPGELSGLPDLPLPLTFWGAIRGRVWNGGVSTDLDALTAFARAASAAEQAKAVDEDR